MSSASAAMTASEIAAVRSASVNPAAGARAGAGASMVAAGGGSPGTIGGTCGIGVARRRVLPTSQAPTISIGTRPAVTTPVYFASSASPSPTPHATASRSPPPRTSRHSA
jgi:hypothetical protein